MDSKVCENCRFWHEWLVQPNPQIIVGDCRRHAPQIFPTQENRFVTKFPSTKLSDFCGSFRHIQPVEDELRR